MGLLHIMKAVTAAIFHHVDTWLTEVKAAVSCSPYSAKSDNPTFQLQIVEYFQQPSIGCFSSKYRMILLDVLDIQMDEYQNYCKKSH